MNIVKYYRIERSGEGRKLIVEKVRVSQSSTSGRSVSHADAFMTRRGFTRRRPVPVHFPEQEPGYHPPSEAQRRRQRQEQRRKAA